MGPEAENFIKFWCSYPVGGTVELSRGIGVTHVYPWHWHEEIQISALEEGPGFLYFRGAEHPTPPGSLLFVPPGEVHTNRHATPGGCTYRTLNVGPDLVSRAFGDLSGAERAFSLRQPVVQDRELFRLFVTTHQRLEDHPPRVVTDGLLMRLLDELLQRTSSLRRREGLGREEHLAIRRAREYLAQHYSETVSLEELSRVANLSPYHLHRVFTRETGLSPHAFQTQVRLSRAKTLLNQGKPLRTVAAETGFADQSHFTREFKRFVGLTPGAYRSDRIQPAFVVQVEEELPEAAVSPA